mgnify:CR=1 FL=1
MGFGLGFGLTLSQKCTLGHRLKHTQKLGFKLLLEQKLNHPEYPNMLKGLEGMKTADKILKEKNARGVLIGGLSEDIWNQRRKLDELIAHKDVDVAVLDNHFELNEPFEHGIDWWLPQTEELFFKSEFSKKKLIQSWYENSAEVILSFGMKININYDKNLLPGLYISDSDWVIKMKLYESLAHVDYNGVDVEIDEDVFEKFELEKRKTIKTKVPKFIAKEFGENILSDEHQKNYQTRNVILLEEFNLETLRAINYLKNKYK